LEQGLVLNYNRIRSMNWNEKRADIIDRLKQFDSIGTIFCYFKGQYPVVDDKGNNIYDPPSIYKIREDLRGLYQNSAKDNFRWEFCSIHVYQNTFDEAFQEFRVKQPEVDKSYFIELEYDAIKKRGLNWQAHRLYDICDKDTYQSIKFSWSKKLQFLEMYHDLELNKAKHEVLAKANVMSDNPQKSISKFDNPHNDIFRDGWSYHLFLEMYNQYVKDSYEEPVRMSYIYYVLEDDGNCIYPNKTRFEKFVRGNYLDQFSRIQQKYYSNDNIKMNEHEDKLNSIKLEFKKNNPRNN